MVTLSAKGQVNSRHRSSSFGNGRHQIKKLCARDDMSLHRPPGSLRGIHHSCKHRKGINTVSQWYAVTSCSPPLLTCSHSLLFSSRLLTTLSPTLHTMPAVLSKPYTYCISSFNKFRGRPICRFLSPLFRPLNESSAHTVYGGSSTNGLLGTNPPGISLKSLSALEQGDPTRNFSPQFIERLSIDSAMAIDLPQLCGTGEVKIVGWSPKDPNNDILTLLDPPSLIPVLSDLLPILGDIPRQYLQGMQSVSIRVRGEPCR
jgi:hypothetical protein